MEVSRVEQRSYINIAVLRGKNAMEYHNELVEALGNNALLYRTVARTNTNHAKAMLSATIAVFFTVAPAGETHMGSARFELRTGVTINEETIPENNKQKNCMYFCETLKYCKTCVHKAE
ncbi:hypothetical protein TNCV_240431 [Trichonephila clavipes]|nr:hypothetical protein TNCV_240431 [Trichonephila clavipes]